MEGSPFTSDYLSKPKRSYYSLGHEIKTTLKFGTYVPIQAIDLVPGDTITIDPMLYLRFMPFLSPPMTSIKTIIDVWYVPNRILWDGWDDFITGNSQEVPPFMKIEEGETIQTGSPYDTLALPGPTSSDGSVSTPTGFLIEFDAFPFAAYVSIWNNFIRDQNLVDEIEFNLTSGLLVSSDPLYTVAKRSPLKRAFNHDYLTSCLPFAQKGDPVQLPLINEDQLLVQMNTGGSDPFIANSAGGPAGAGDLVTDAGGNIELSAAPGTNLRIQPNGSLYVDPNVDAVTINQFREAIIMQEFLERDAKGGTRIWETIYTHFGVRIKDYRVDIPEFISRSTGNVSISEVMSSVYFQDGESIIPQGTPAGKGTIGINGRRGKYYATEFGYLMVMLNVQPVTSYTNFLERKWTRRLREEYLFPTFAKLGEQEVLKQEANFNWENPEINAQTFGYQRRYAEYMFINDRTTGEFKNTLQFWHLARQFSPNSDIELNEEFVMVDEEQEDFRRIFAVQDGTDYILAQCYVRIGAERPLSSSQIPATLG